MNILQWSLLSAAVLALCSVVPYIFAPAEPFSGYAMSPGIIVGMYASAAISGYPHGVETIPLLIIAGIVNFFFWTLVCYAALAVFRKLSKKNSQGR